MQQVSRFALVPYRQDQMFDLVRRVEGYPEFLAWCHDARLISENTKEQVAELSIRLAGFSQAFSTKNRLATPDRIDMSLVDGPFEHLEGYWLFSALGEDGCRVELNLAFEFSSRLLNAAFQKAFSRIIQKLVNDFCQQARVCYE